MTEPAPKFTEEDRSRVDELVEMADRIASVGGFPREQVDSLTRALAYITHLEGALMAAAWPIHAMGDDHPDMPGWAREPIKWLHDLQARADHLEGALEAADELARAAADLIDLGEEYGRADIARYDSARDGYLSARAALPTSKEDAG